MVKATNGRSLPMASVMVRATDATPRRRLKSAASSSNSRDTHMTAAVLALIPEPIPSAQTTVVAVGVRS